MPTGRVRCSGSAIAPGSEGEEGGGGKAGYRDERGVDDCLSSRNGDPQCFAAMIRGGDAPITEKTWQPCEIGDNFVERRFDNSRDSRRGTLGT